jgi:DNA modification methylase
MGGKGAAAETRAIRARAGSGDGAPGIGGADAGIGAGDAAGASRALLEGQHLQVALRPVAGLRGYEHNARTHSPQQVEALARSIEAFGWTVPILVDAEGVVIAGHGRLAAAELLHLEQVPVVELGHLTAEQRRALVIADNQLPLGAGWDQGVLAAELAELGALDFDLDLLGFDSAALDRLLAAEPLDDDLERTGEVIEAPPPTPFGQAVSCSGDVWAMGSHRLICGDAGDAATVRQLMGTEQAALCFTSPPYLEQREYRGSSSATWEQLMQHVCRALPMRDDAQVLVNLGLVHRDGEWLAYWANWCEWMRRQGWRQFGLYVWDKLRGAALSSDGRLRSSFELVFHFNRSARKPNKTVACAGAGNKNATAVRGRAGGFSVRRGVIQPSRVPDSVIRLNCQSGGIGEDLDHPAVFPVALAEFFQTVYSDRHEIVYEPFCGSGSSLIAAQRCTRVARAVEIAPDYVDVALLRWCQTFPRVVPVLVATGESWPQVVERRRAEQQATQTSAPGVEC